MVENKQSKQFLITVEYETPVQTLLGIRASSSDEAVQLVLEGIDTKNLPGFKILSVEEDLSGDMLMKAESKLAIN